MRTFLALELPNAEVTRLETWSHHLRQMCQDPTMKLSWVKPSDFHLTLRFFGEIEEEQSRRIIECVSTVASVYKPVPVLAGKLGVFPNWRQPRVLWAGIEPEGTTLHELFRDLDDTFAAHDLGRYDKDEYHPHITLARIRDAESHALSKTLETQKYAAWSQGFALSTLTLYRSELHPAGAIYTPLRTWPMGKENA